MRKRVYVAGPYTNGDPCVNTHAALVAGDRLLAAGFAPFVPHLSHFWHTMSPHKWEEWIELDLAWVTAADALLLLPGKSKGAEKEVEVAFAHGIIVFDTVEEIVAFFAPGKDTTNGTPEKG